MAILETDIMERLKCERQTKPGYDKENVVDTESDGFEKDRESERHTRGKGESGWV